MSALPTRPRTHKIRLNVRFSPKATELLRANEMTRCATNRRHSLLGSDTLITEAIAVRALLQATLQQKCPKLVERGLALARNCPEIRRAKPESSALAGITQTPRPGEVIKQELGSDVLHKQRHSKRRKRRGRR